MCYDGHLYLMGMFCAMIRRLDLLCCRDEKSGNYNINSGYGMEISSNQSLAVQTPAIDFTVHSTNVSSFLSVVVTCMLGFRLSAIQEKSYK